jgi:hypothetical protein
VCGGRIWRCGLGLFGCRRFRVSRHSSRPPVLPSFPPTAVLLSFPHASGGNPVRSYREALSILVVLCTIGGAGSPTKTLGDDGGGVCGDDGDGVCRDDGDGVGSDARYRHITDHRYYCHSRMPPVSPLFPHAIRISVIPACFWRESSSFMPRSAIHISRALHDRWRWIPD